MTNNSPTADILEYWQYILQVTNVSGTKKYANYIYAAKSALILAYSSHHLMQPVEGHYVAWESWPRRMA